MTASEPQISVGARVQQARMVSALSQSELARRLRVVGLSFHQQTIWQIESGRRPVRVDECAALASELHVDAAWLAGFTTEGGGGAERYREGFRDGAKAARRLLDGLVEPS